MFLDGVFQLWQVKTTIGDLRQTAQVFAYIPFTMSLAVLHPSTKELCGTLGHVPKDSIRSRRSPDLCPFCVPLPWNVQAQDPDVRHCATVGAIPIE